MRVKFDSRSEAHKTPFGAVKSGENIDFIMYVYNDIFVDFIKIIINNTHDDFSETVYFQYDGCVDGYSKYICRVCLIYPQIYYYTFEFTTEHGRFFSGQEDGRLMIGENLPKWQLTVYDKNFNVPDWVSGGIMYQIFPDRFMRSANFSPLPAKNERTIHENWNEIPAFIYDTSDYRANDYFGGNLDGIIEKLDYLKSLHVNILYLNPIFESPENHRYSTADYKNIDPYLGDMHAFKRLVEACDKRDIKIILDGVFSHTGADSIYFNKYNHYDSLGAYQSTESSYYPWYRFFSHPNGYESWWGFRNLPNVNEGDPSYMDFIFNPEDGVLKTWADMGIGGWRLDVCDELPEPFLYKLRETVKSHNSQAFIIGEVWEDATNKESYGIKRKYLLGGQLDSVMNYPFRTAIVEYVKYADAALFDNRIMRILENYPAPAIKSLMNVIGTHDTVRIITELGNETAVEKEKQGRYTMSSLEYENGRERLKMAAFLQFSLPGIPSLYYGDEVGLEGFSDPYCRKTFPYDDMDLDILDFYKRLSKCRADHKHDFESSFHRISCQEGLYSFQRGKLIFIINNNDYGYTVEYKLLFGHGVKDGTMAPRSFGVFQSPKTATKGL